MAAPCARTRLSSSGTCWGSCDGMENTTDRCRIETRGRWTSTRSMRPVSAYAVSQYASKGHEAVARVGAKTEHEARVVEHAPDVGEASAMRPPLSLIETVKVVNVTLLQLRNNVERRSRHRSPPVMPTGRRLSCG